MRNPLTSRRQEKPFLSPLGKQRALPAITAPLALTVCGGVALVLTFGTLFGLQPGRIAPTGAQSETRAAPSPSPTVADGQTAPAEEEEPAMVTALPESPSSGDYGTVIDPAGPQDTAQAEAGSDPAASSDPNPTATIPSPRPAGIASYAPEAGGAAAVEDAPAPTAAPIPDPAPAARQTPPATATARAGMRPAVVNRAVNMRASPNNGGRVVLVVPGNARIEAQDNCGWCEISYQGSSGFIYRSFITYR